MREFSGVSTLLRDRKGGSRLLDKLRSGDVLVVRWLDRLGRNYVDVTDTIRELMRRGVVIKTIINGMVFDGTATEPMQAAVRDALIGFMAAMAQSQVEASKEAQKAGIAHAKGNEINYLGRAPQFDREQLTAVSAMLESGETNMNEIARVTKLNRNTVYRIKADPVKADASLTKWEEAREERKRRA